MMASRYTQQVRAAVHLHQRRAAGDLDIGSGSGPSGSDTSELEICFLRPGSLSGGAASSWSSELLSSQLSDSSTVAPSVEHPAQPVTVMILIFNATRCCSYSWRRPPSFTFSCLLMRVDLYIRNLLLDLAFDAWRERDRKREKEKEKEKERERERVRERVCVYQSACCA